ncbi:apolipoprotein N-acyltransferase [Streptomyces venezuelae]|uniref:Apolipoprotein N-acyltransferase n=1 Tax=Streptomyces venezuelae TaxID=54571 RepID=A0A5P2CCS3_STRVZ|nr:apolipoprotein N-acyltransferase [Streptomyces venezuelae]QES40333.1 apolipoprotein N-acyltransferase [Streptomyces venezuelae]
MELSDDDRRERYRQRAGRLLASRWWRGALAVTAGALPALAFPAPSLWWFAYVALVPWLLLARSAPTARRAALDGWLGGLGFMVAVHHWLLPSLHVFTVVIAALLGLLWAPWGWLVRRVLGGVPGPARAAGALVVLPSGWLLVELVRSWEGLGGPWGLLGSSQWQVPPALRLASVGGVWLVSAFVVVVNTGVALLAVAGAAGAARTSTGRTGAPATGYSTRQTGAPATGYSTRQTGAPGTESSTRQTGAPGTDRAAKTQRPTSLTAPILPALAGILTVATATAAAWAWAPRPESAGHTRVAVVQPGIIADGIASADKRLAREEALTRTLAGRHPDLVVWGESSVGFDLADRPDVARRIAALSREVGADILVNVDARRSDRPGIFKSSVLVGPDGPTGDRYDKMRLVPFGEYIPARSLLGWATSVGKAAGEDRRRGDRQVVMRTGHDLRVGPLVCFESAFPDMSRRLTRDGAQLLLAQSATSSFQNSWAPRQHASLAAVRAAETGRPMVHATLTGVSAVYGPEGSRVGSTIGTSASAAALYDVPLATGETAYVEWGDWPVHAALLVLLALGLTEGLRSLRSRRSPGQAAGSAAPATSPDPAPEPREPHARTAHGSPARPGR